MPTTPTYSPQQFAAAWQAMPDTFRAAHPRPMERTHESVAAWLNEIHKASETAVLGCIRQATVCLAADDHAAAGAVLVEARPFRHLMRMLDELAKRSH